MDKEQSWKTCTDWFQDLPLGYSNHDSVDWQRIENTETDPPHIGSVNFQQRYNSIIKGKSFQKMVLEWTFLWKNEYRPLSLNICNNWFERDYRYKFKN